MLGKLFLLLFLGLLIYATWRALMLTGRFVLPSAGGVAGGLVDMAVTRGLGMSVFSSLGAAVPLVMLALLVEVFAFGAVLWSMF
jgi:hypothetical protein